MVKHIVCRVSYFHSSKKNEDGGDMQFNLARSEGAKKFDQRFRVFEKFDQFRSESGQSQFRVRSESGQSQVRVESGQIQVRVRSESYQRKLTSLKH